MQNELLVDRDEVDLSDVFLTLWAKKNHIFIAGLLAGLIAVIVSLSLPNVYTAEITLAPVADNKPGGMSGIAGRLGDIASIAGFNLGGGSGVDLPTLGIEILTSRTFLSDFIVRHEMLFPLLGNKGWNEKLNDWEADPELYNKSSSTWVSDSKKPSLLKASQVFRKSISISQDKKTQIIKLSVQSQSPGAAKIWAESLIFDINEYLRKRDIEQAEKSIDYLKKKLSETSISQMQTILFQLIEEQTRTALLASVRDGYAFQVIDPAVVPEERTSPKRTVIVIISTVSTVLIMMLIVLVSDSLRRKRLSKR